MGIGAGFGEAKWAGFFGGLTTIGTVLTLTLHCVKAQGWQDRMKTEIDAIRLELVYEHGSAPDEEGLASLSKKLRELKVKMSEEWEKIISQQPGRLGAILKMKTSPERS